LRQYQAYLFRERKLAPNTMIQRTAALRFFFVATLRKPWSLAETPYPRKTFRLPKVLSAKQVARLIDAAPTLFYRVFLMTLYATGLRRAELAHLKVSDIDKERMVIHVKGGKAGKTAMSCSARNCWRNWSATCIGFGGFDCPPRASRHPADRQTFTAERAGLKAGPHDHGSRLCCGKKACGKVWPMNVTRGR
jgi:site-specific recombinase XerC